jgi:hypothetical protein
LEGQPVNKFGNKQADMPIKKKKKIKNLFAQNRDNFREPG